MTTMMFERIIGLTALVVMVVAVVESRSLQPLPEYTTVLTNNGGHATFDSEFDPNPQYSYSYDVNDKLTGDAKSQQETRHGDVVEGSYSLLEADGTRRVVHYTADPHNGFNAVVEKQQPAHVAPVHLAHGYEANVHPIHGVPSLSRPLSYH